ncbi:ABC transporter ATP-binding protein [Pelagibius litoralis]|uniref:Spermidine/putrescine import ATP-binding protein PotA n=1 Tax=Pelagibius litoralis TaxID=374515 RepID=A0A967C3W9_9PROT|nr:ABC transporter ATP-binding protein [Pelagibius litoralis]NIA68049.1 ABC transporter ATP-binding protein [Pelagibius litoralis]
MNAADNVITTRNLTKRFGGVTAVDGISFGLRENEFFALLGPSGCGKTTLLRLIAGFEQADGGSILLDGEDLTALRPNRRPINLMFQSYALFPHMTVEGNVAYGLEMERLPKAEIAARTAEVLAKVQLGDLARRKPQQLSGGQRQRVALARALVKRPRVLLLDEPLGALDKKLREEMQLELKRLQHEVGITFVVVTHDQEEALVMADRIAVLDAGRIAQIGTPRDLYEEPASRFVAAFIGAMNFFEGETTAQGLAVAGHGLLTAALPSGVAPGQPASLAVRPERLSMAAARPADGANAVAGRVVDIAYHGTDLSLHVAVAGVERRVLARLPSNRARDAGWQAGQEVWCCWAPEDSRILVA